MTAMSSENERKRKIVYILLALVVSISLWLYADVFGVNGSARQVTKTFEDIPITYLGENKLADKGLMLLPDSGTTTSVDLEIKTSRFRISDLDRDDISVTVDLSGVESAGIQTVRYDTSFANKKFTTAMISERSVYSATVNITELNSKDVNVVCDLVGNVAEGYSAGQIHLSQETLEIRGQEADIAPVSYAKVTLDIGENAMESVTADLEVQYYDANDQLLEGTGIHPTAHTVQARLPVYVTKELTLKVDFQTAPGVSDKNLNYEIKPSTITVSGEAGALRDINTITLGELDLLNLLSSGATRHTFSIIVPEGCDNLSGVTRATLEISFVDMERAQVSTENFSYTGLSNGKSAEILTHQLTISIFGKAEDVAAVTGEDITVVADLSSYTGASGTYTVPAQVQVNTNGDVGVAGTYHIQITIQSSEEPPEGGEPAEE